MVEEFDINFWMVDKNVSNDKNGGLWIAMMWIAQWLFLLKVATINSALEFVMDSSIIVLSYNNIVPWHP